MGDADTVQGEVRLDNHGGDTRDALGPVLAKIPMVLVALRVSGAYDPLIRIAVRDDERRRRDQRYRMPGIRQPKANFDLRRLKQGDPLLNEVSAGRQRAAPAVHRPPRHGRPVA